MIYFVFLLPWVYLPSKAHVENAPLQERFQILMVQWSTDSNTCWEFKFAKNRLSLKLSTQIVKEQRIKENFPFTFIFTSKRDLEISNYIVI